jgi:hypothetical protein
MIDYTSNHYIYDESCTIAYFNIIPDNSHVLCNAILNI